MNQNRPDFENRVFDIGVNEFRVGTCSVLWFVTLDCYVIIAIKNAEPGNGHFKHALSWFYDSCRRDMRNLRILEVGTLSEFGIETPWLRDYLTKEGFVPIGEGDMIKHFK